MSSSATPSTLSFRELARERFDALESSLHLHSQGHDVNEVVHETRRNLKKLRALLRLLRPYLDGERYRLENESLRNLGHMLAPLRDAWVRVTILENLCKELDARLCRGALEIVERHLRESYEKVLSEHPPEHLIKKATGVLEKSRSVLPEWPEPEGDSFAVCQASLKRTYDKARSRLLLSLSQPSTGNLHELRKRSKDLRHQMEFLDHRRGKPFRRLVASIRELTDLLGKNHDVAILRESMEVGVHRSLSHTQLRAIHKTLEERHRSTMDAGLDLGSRIFAAKPQRFLKQLESKWAKSQPAR